MIRSRDGHAAAELPPLSGFKWRARGKSMTAPAKGGFRAGEPPRHRVGHGLRHRGESRGHAQIR